MDGFTAWRSRHELFCFFFGDAKKEAFWFFGKKEQTVRFFKMKNKLFRIQNHQLFDNFGHETGETVSAEILHLFSGLFDQFVEPFLDFWRFDRQIGAVLDEV